MSGSPMDPSIEILERHLGALFVPVFAKAIISKQLANIGESRESFTHEELDELLGLVEEKVLRTFLKGDSADFIDTVRREIQEAVA